MQWLLLGVFGVLFFLVLLTLIPVYITINYQREQNKDDFHIEFCLLRWIHFVHTIPAVNTSSGKSPGQEKISSPINSLTSSERRSDSRNLGTAISRWRDISETLDRFRWATSLLYAFLTGEPEVPSLLGIPNLGVITASAIVLTRDCRAFSWRTKIGLDEAATTALATGLLWSAKEGIVSFLSRYVHFRCVPDLAVIPDFHSFGVGVCLRCIFRVNVGHIIIVGIRNLAQVGILKGAKAVGQ